MLPSYSAMNTPTLKTNRSPLSIRFLRARSDSRLSAALRAAMVALGVSYFSCSSPQACTNANCTNNVTITLRPTLGGPLSAGDYILEVRADGTVKTLYCTVASTGASPGCNGGNLVYGALLEGSDGVSGLQAIVETDAAQIAITLRSGETVLVMTTVEPSYQNVYPNGEACGPVCRGASVDLPF